MLSPSPYFKGRDKGEPRMLSLRVYPTRLFHQYFVMVGIGQPVKPIRMLLDTGGALNWVQCYPCYNCNPDLNSIYVRSVSTSHKPLTCDVLLCEQFNTSFCASGLWVYDAVYGDESTCRGEWVSETVTLASTAFHQIAIGCTHIIGGTFGGLEGVLGLGASPVSLPFQIKADSFMLCLVSPRSSVGFSELTFRLNSGNNRVKYGKKAVITWLFNKAGKMHHYVGLTGISVSSKKLNDSTLDLELPWEGSGGVIVDTGSDLSYLHPQMYEDLRDAFRTRVTALSRFKPFALLPNFEDCYDSYQADMSTAHVPSMTLHFDGGKIELPQENLLVPVDYNLYCFAFAPANTEYSILGNRLLKGIGMEFDLVHRCLTLVPDYC